MGKTGAFFSIVLCLLVIDNQLVMVTLVQGDAAVASIQSYRKFSNKKR